MKQNDEPTQNLFDLLECMRQKKIPFNATIETTKGDVPHLSLLGNGAGWEACYYGGAYDLWFKGFPKKFGLSCEVAANELLNHYSASKFIRAHALNQRKLS